MKHNLKYYCKNNSIIYFYSAHPNEYAYQAGFNYIQYRCDTHTFNFISIDHIPDMDDLEVIDNEVYNIYTIGDGFYEMWFV
jgi:hypothetical protein